MTIQLTLLLGVLAAAAPRGAWAARGDPTSIADATWIQMAAANFTMGTAQSAWDAEGGANNENWPSRGVSLSAYAMMDTEVTNAQYVAFLNEAYPAGWVKVGVEDRDWQRQHGAEVQVALEGPYENDSMVLMDGESLEEGPINHCYVGFDNETETFYVTNASMSGWPVVFVRWYGAYLFAEWYNASLPSSAQWEWAARGGEDFAYSSPTGELDVAVVNYRPSDGVGWRGSPAPVRTYPANPYGFYELGGNVWEWAMDWYASDYYACENASTADPWGPERDEPAQDGTAVGGPGRDYDDSSRVTRGGSYNYHDATIQATYLRGDFPFRGNDHFGFRLAVNDPGVVYTPDYGCYPSDDDDRKRDDDDDDSGLPVKYLLGGALAVVVLAGVVSVAAARRRELSATGPAAGENGKAKVEMGSV